MLKRMFMVCNPAEIAQFATTLKHVLIDLPFALHKAHSLIQNIAFKSAADRISCYL